MDDRVEREGLERLGRFLRHLRADVYPEPEREIHTAFTHQVGERFFQIAGLAAGARILDVGCGQGVALEMFRERGLQPTGVTLGDDAEVCRAKGFDTVEADFAFLDFPDAAFDALWCRHALEHGIFPYFTLCEFNRLLVDGGWLYVEVPSPDSACRHETNPNHYSVLGLNMWVQLMRRAGFTTVDKANLSVATKAGPDVYFGFVLRKSASAPGG